jgi:hypothetical protein
LFNSVLHSIFQKLNWANRGFHLNGSRISNIRFADDATLMSDSEEDLPEMLNELKERSEEVGLLNWNKTKIMTNANDDEFQIGYQKIEKVEIFKFLGVQVSFVNRENHEISRRISSAWKAFWSYKRFFTDKNLALYYKRRLMVRDGSGH